MPGSVSAVAALVAGRDPEERARGLAGVGRGPEGPGAAALLEGALVDLLGGAPELLPDLVRALAAQRSQPEARRALDLLARVPGAPEARALALESLRGEAAPDPAGAFRDALSALARALPASPLRERLVRFAGTDKVASPEAAARAFAAAYEAARASSSAELVAKAREELAPTLSALGLTAGFDPAADEGAFDARAAAGVVGTELARPSVRARTGAVVVRGVVFTATSPAPAPAEGAPAPVGLDEALGPAVRRLLEAPTSADARAEAFELVADALASRLEGAPPAVVARGLDEEVARAASAAGASPSLGVLERALRGLAR